MWSHCKVRGGVEREWPSDIVILFFCERRWTLLKARVSKACMAVNLVPDCWKEN